MGSLDPRAVGAMILLTLAALFVFDRSMDLLYGRITLEQALTSSWIGFATSNPFLFALITVGGTYIFGRAFVALLENA